MREKFWLCKRGNVYVSLDSETGKRESLRTSNKEHAKQIVEAKNNATRQPALNIAIANPQCDDQRRQLPSIPMKY